MLVRPVLIAACALTVAACGHHNAPDLAATQPRGATVAFESIDGPPPGQFQTLVRNLNEEAQARRLAVMSRASASAYRVRGYLAAKVDKNNKGRTTISWVWDVFDRDQNRAFRIEGAEHAEGRHHAWAAADDAMLGRIARDSMDKLAGFLTSPDAAPTPAPAVAQTVFTLPDDTSPEASGIYRIFRPHADPLPASPADSGGVPNDIAGDVPLPPQRPDSSAALVPARLAPGKLAPTEKVAMAAAAQ